MAKLGNVGSFTSVGSGMLAAKGLGEGAVRLGMRIGADGTGFASKVQMFLASNLGDTITRLVSDGVVFGTAMGLSRVKGLKGQKEILEKASMGALLEVLDDLTGSANRALQAAAYGRRLGAMTQLAQASALDPLQAAEIFAGIEGQTMMSPEQKLLLLKSGEGLQQGVMTGTPTASVYASQLDPLTAARILSDVKLATAGLDPATAKLVEIKVGEGLARGVITGVPEASAYAARAHAMAFRQAVPAYAPNAREVLF